MSSFKVKTRTLYKEVLPKQTSCFFQRQCHADVVLQASAMLFTSKTCSKATMQNNAKQIYDCAFHAPPMFH